MTSDFLNGICDNLGKIDKDDLESRRDTTSIGLTPSVSETITLSRPFAADNFPCYASTGGNLSARASTVESEWLADSARCERLIPNKETTEAVVERANVSKDEALVRP